MTQTGFAGQGVLPHGLLNLSGLAQWNLVKPQHSLFCGVSDQDNPVGRNETPSLYCLALWLYPDPCEASRRCQSSGLCLFGPCPLLKPCFGAGNNLKGRRQSLLYRSYSLGCRKSFRALSAFPSCPFAQECISVGFRILTCLSSAHAPRVSSEVEDGELQAAWS